MGAVLFWYCTLQALFSEQMGAELLNELIFSQYSLIVGAFAYFVLILYSPIINHVFRANGGSNTYRFTGPKRNNTAI